MYGKVIETCSKTILTVPNLSKDESIPELLCPRICNSAGSKRAVQCVVSQTKEKIMRGVEAKGMG
jgi:hypothetical protein